MKIPNRLRRLDFSSCPDQESIEKILLRARKNPVVYRAFEQHMLTCSHCQSVVKRLQAFYEILETEIAKPASPKVVRFAQSLKKRVKPE